VSEHVILDSFLATDKEGCMRVMMFVGFSAVLLLMMLMMMTFMMMMVIKGA